MAFRAVSVCLVAFVLIQTSSGAGVKAKTKAKTKDPWDVPDGSEELEAAPQGAAESQESEMSPEDQAGLIEKVQERSAVRRAHNQHQVMSQFMKTFSNNMRLSVLADSKGDMPEEERQRLIAKAEATQQQSSGDGPSFGPPPQEAAGDDEGPPPQPQRRSHRMLNMAEARHQRARHRSHARLLPEAEGIGFPPPEGMAPDPATEGLVNDPGMSYSSDEAAPQQEVPQEEQEEVAPPPPPRPRTRRHHLHMLNARPGETRKVRRPHARGGEQKHDQLPPGIVRDEMGRAMPLLSFGGKPAHSGAFQVAAAPLGALVIGLFFVSW